MTDEIDSAHEPDEATLAIQAKYIYKSVDGMDLESMTTNGWDFVSVVGRGRNLRFLVRKSKT